MVFDRIEDTTVSIGTGAFALANSAPVGRLPFGARYANGATLYYECEDATGANWEVGIGLYSTTGPSISRTTVLSSSNSDGLVNFPAGTKRIYVPIAADMLPLVSQGDLLYFNGTRFSRIPIGASGTMLCSNGTTPYWSPGIHWNIIPTGTVNGVNNTFTLPDAPNPPSSLMLFNDIGLLTQGGDYTLSGSTITFICIPLTGAVLRATYPY